MSETTVTPVANAPVISIRSISKRYKINAGKKDSVQSHDPEFYALRNVSFELLKGDIIGIIGSNGSGKTTLLKILSSVTKPTEGEITIRGTVTSILDIGSNFHPELTGRENTKMHLRLNHVSKAMQAEKIELVKNFSGIGDFFDQPVKYYSNGMFLRLAFSVVFNNDADILILDEVMAVGDDSFRMKCNDHFRELKNRGKSIIFVSHSKHEILELSTKCLWLDKGSVRKMGEPLELIAEYYDVQKQLYEQDQKSSIVNDPTTASIIDSANDGVQKQWALNEAPGNEIIRLRSVCVGNTNGSVNDLYTDSPVQIKVVVDKLQSDISICTLLVLHDMFNEEVLLIHSLNNRDQEDFTRVGIGQTGLFEFSCEIPARLLKAGNYYLTLHLGKNPMKETSVVKVRELMGLFILQQNIHFRLRNRHGDVDYIGEDMKVAVRPALKWSVTNRESQK
jgi:ABC-type polysaccharide/polyol phosphate transport system ATPase subunit